MGEPAIPATQREDESKPQDTSQQKSYAAIVNKRPSLQKYDYEVSMIDGIPTIEVPAEVKDSVPLWDDFLVGRFPDLAPHVAKIHVIVNKIWTLGDKSKQIDVFELNSKSVKFRIRDAAMRARIQRRGMWNIAGQPMTVAKWSPILEETLPEIETMKLWVTVKNVPQALYSWQGFGFLTSPVGHPIRLHPETEQCSDFEIGKVFVEVNLSQEVPKSFRFKLGQEYETVEFEYPWLPPRCTRCSRWGHLEDICVMKKGSLLKSQVVEHEEGEVDVSQVGSNSQAATVETDLITASAPVSNAASVSEDSMPKTTQPAIDISATGEENEEGWSVVSPGKGCKSHEKSTLAYGGVTILAPSRFSVLQDETNESCKDQDNETGKDTPEQVTLPTTENTETTGPVENTETIEQYAAIPQKQQTLRPNLPRSSKSTHKTPSESASTKHKDHLPNTYNRRTPKKTH